MIGQVIILSNSSCHILHPMACLIPDLGGLTLWWATIMSLCNIRVRFGDIVADKKAIITLAKECGLAPNRAVSPFRLEYLCNRG